MNRTVLRIFIIVATVITALIHLALGVGGIIGGKMDAFTIPFIFNGIGYFVLLVMLFIDTPLVGEDDRPVVHWLLIGYAALTFVLYFVFNGFGNFGVTSIASKASEAVVILATFFHLRAS
jgi:hypothetical protein